MWLQSSCKQNLNLKIMERDKGNSPRQHFNNRKSLLHENDEKDSSSSEDDENAELLTDELEEGFFKVLSQLKKKDSKLYEESVKYYPGNFSEEDKRTKKKSLKDYKEWLRGQKEKIESEEIKEELEALHDFWTSPTLNKDEQFLRDYILNKKFLEQDDNFNIEEEINKLSDEEKEVEEQLIFEHKYNCRFEDKDHELVQHKKSKTKRKRDKEVKHQCSSSVCSEIEPRTENVDNTEQETNTESPKRKRRKKKNKHSEIETVLEDIMIEEAGEKETDDYKTVAKHINSEHNKVTTKPYTPIKAHKFKDKTRHKSQSREKQTYEPIVSCEDVHQAESSHPNRKLKKKNQNDTVNNCTIEIGGNVKSVLHKNMLKAVQNLPRNLQMKHKMGKKKMRHRNQKKSSSINNDRNTKEKGSSHTCAFNHKIKEKEQRNRPEHQQLKKSKHLHNLIVKGKKNKELRLINIKSKKHKAAKSVSKRELAN